MEVVPPLVICIWRQESEPLGLVQLLAFVKGIGPGICTSPCLALPFFTNCSKLRATCKSTPRNVKQRWWDACSMIRRFRERLSCCSCEQCAKVEPKISMTSVWDKYRRPLLSCMVLVPLCTAMVMAWPLQGELRPWQPSIPILYHPPLRSES